MNQENHVLTLARKAQLICETAPVSRFLESTDLTPYLDRYYKLVRNKALEDAAKEAESMKMYPGGRQEAPAHDSVWHAARAIRQMKAPE